MNDISELDPDEWKGGIELFNCMNSPWFKLLDPDKFERHVDRVQQMDIQVLAACHTPVIRKPQIDQAFGMIRKIPMLEPPPQPTQLDLEALMHAVATGQQFVWEPPAPPA
jgi:hypothetical protein